MAPKTGPTIWQEESYPGGEEFAREAFDDARMLDLDGEEESPFLRGQKRVSVRRGPLPKKAAAGLKWVALVLAVAGVCGMAAAALYRYGERSWRFRIESSDNLEITGIHSVTHAQVMEVMGGDIGRNIFFIPLAQRKAQLEQIPWVESASVMRFVPNRLKVEIHERTPAAFARVGSRILLIDAGGTLMELPRLGKTKYSFPVILGMNPSEPHSTRAPRMKIYNQLVQELDSGGGRYSQDLSEVDLSDPDDVRVLVSDSAGAVLVHLGSSNFLERYKIYVSHVREWRQQFDKLESVDLRYDRQIIVNPDLRGTVKQAPLSTAAVKAAMAAGVKPAALVHHQVMPPGTRTVVPITKPAANRVAAKPAAKKKAKSIHRKHTVKKVTAKSAALQTVKTEAKSVTPGAQNAPAGGLSVPPKPAGDRAKAGKKPSPAIAKGQERR